MLQKVLLDLVEKAHTPLIEEQEERESSKITKDYLDASAHKY